MNLKVKSQKKKNTIKHNDGYVLIYLNYDGDDFLNETMIKIYRFCMLEVILYLLSVLGDKM